MKLTFSTPGTVIEDMWKNSPTRTGELNRPSRKFQVIITLDEENEVSTIQYSGTHHPPATAIAYQSPYVVACLIDNALDRMTEALPTSNLLMFPIQNFVPDGTQHVTVNKTTRIDHENGQVIIPEIVN